MGDRLELVQSRLVEFSVASAGGMRLGKGSRISSLKPEGTELAGPTPYHARSAHPHTPPARIDRADLAASPETCGSCCATGIW
jgi:hypothetical protein